MKLHSLSIGGAAGARIVLACAAAAAVALAAGCSKESAPETQVTVQAEHPEVGTIAEQVNADAVLAPVDQAAIAPKITAPIKKFYVQRGQRVRAGQLLVVLENQDLTAAEMDNRGAYEAAQAAYVTATKSQVPEETLKAESDLAQAKTNLDLQQSIVNSRKKLFAEGAIPGRDLDTAEAALVQAKAAYDAANVHLQALKSYTHAAALQAAKGQLTSAEGKLKGAQAQVGYSEIRSPINGVVTDRPLFDGETAAAGTPVITVMETATLIAKTHLSQAMAQQLQLGSPAKVTVAGLESPVPAAVSMISPALDPGSSTVEVWLKINNKSGELKPGTPVKVTISGRPVAHALTIPLSAVLTADNGKKSVMVVASDGTAQPKPLTLGVNNGDDVQVLSGVTPADMVITSGSFGLDKGTKVKIGPAPQAGDDGDGGF